MGNSKYIVIAKIGNNEDKTANTVKYHTNNLLKFVIFLDNKFPKWVWFNVFNKKTNIQIASYTKYNRPISAKII